MSRADAPLEYPWKMSRSFNWTLSPSFRSTTRLDDAARTEWLVCDGAGGYAMGSVGGLRTRRYHGLLVAPDPVTGRRHLGLAALDLFLIIGDERIGLSTHEWRDGTIHPDGHHWLSSFSLSNGVPRWRWLIGDVVVERELAMARGQAAVGVVHRVLRAPGPVRLELQAMVTWRDAHGERFADPSPVMESGPDAFRFESRLYVYGPGFTPIGQWHLGVGYRTERDRGLPDHEDLFCAGRFTASLTGGEEMGVEAWVGDARPASAVDLVEAARLRAQQLAVQARATDPIDAMLVHAADQFIVAGPDVLAGYPWFGAWSRDSMTSYEGLFLSTGRESEGAALLERLATTISDGMLANTADAGMVEYNTVDAALWFMHAVGRHMDCTGDLDLGARLEPALRSIVHGYQQGTRFGIRLDSDGLVTQGQDGVALTWMDARVDMRPITQRSGKPVEINALWIAGLNTLVRLRAALGLPAGDYPRLAAMADRTFCDRFRSACGLADVIDGPAGDDRRLRPNQLLASALPGGPHVDARAIIAACRPLVTPLGLRTLGPAETGYRGQHRGSMADRDSAYHQGTVWPWLIGAYVDTLLAANLPTDGVLDGLLGHLGDAGLGSVSEVVDGDAPHEPSGCPFQAWSVAELLRVRRRLQASS